MTVPFFLGRIRSCVLSTMRCPHTGLPVSSLCRTLQSPPHQKTCHWIWALRRASTNWPALRDILRHNLHRYRASTVRAILRRHHLEPWWTGAVSPAGLPVLCSDTPPHRGLLLLQAAQRRCTEGSTLLELLLARRVREPTAFVERWRRQLVTGRRRPSPAKPAKPAKPVADEPPAKSAADKPATKPLISRLCNIWFYPQW